MKFAKSRNPNPVAQSDIILSGPQNSAGPFAAKPSLTPYIVSPRADLLLIVGAVLLCPALLLPLAKVSSPYTVWLVVMTFGAVGHHLPSFLRTYGDRDLFRRYRTRFILAPLLLFSVTLAFSLRGLHGMLLVSMCWSIWHGMMQHFGFLRIYDSKVRATSLVSARLDWWISASWFGMCLAFSPNQGGSLLNALYDSGIPLVPLPLIDGLRVALAVLAAVVTLLYVVHAIRGKQPRSWMKLGLLGGTFAYVWLVRVMTHNPYLSVALFELLHDVQYLAIVWAFNRRLAEKGSTGVLPRFFYRPRAGSVAGYVAACLAYGAIGLTVYTQFSAGLFKQLMEAILITSGLLHFYYDGFIWKLGQPDTQRGLGLNAGTVSFRRAWGGVGHAALVGLPIILLGSQELRRAKSDELERAQALVQAVPDNPTSLNNLGFQLVQRGRLGEAVPQLRKALTLQPDLTAARELLSGTLADLSKETAQAGHLPEALAQCREALLLQPNSADLHNDFAVLLSQAGQLKEAEADFRRALELDPTHKLARENLDMMERTRKSR